MTRSSSSLLAALLLAAAVVPAAQAQTVPNRFLGEPLSETLSGLPEGWTATLQDKDDDHVESFPREDNLLWTVDKFERKPITSSANGLSFTMHCEHRPVWIYGAVAVSEKFNCTQLTVRATSATYVAAPNHDQLEVDLHIPESGRYTVWMDMLSPSGAVVGTRQLYHLEERLTYREFSEFEDVNRDGELKRVYYRTYSEKRGFGDYEDDFDATVPLRVDLSQAHGTPVRLRFEAFSEVTVHSFGQSVGAGGHPDNETVKVGRSVKVMRTQNRENVMSITRLAGLRHYVADPSFFPRPTGIATTFRTSQPDGGWTFSRSGTADLVWNPGYGHYMAELKNGGYLTTPSLAPVQGRDQLVVRVGRSAQTPLADSTDALEAVVYEVFDGAQGQGDRVARIGTLARLAGPLSPLPGLVRYAAFDLSAYRGKRVRVQLRHDGTHPVWIGGAEGVDVDREAYPTREPDPGYALALRGQTAYRLGTMAELGLIGGDFTLEGWFRFDDPTVKQSIFGHDGPNAHRQKLHALLHQGGKPYFDLFGTGLTADVTLQPDRWYHLAFSFNSYDNRVRIFVDGSQVADRGIDGPLHGHGHHSLFLGETFLGGVARMNGQADEVRVWRRAYDDSELTPLALGPVHGGERGLTLLATFDHLESYITHDVPGGQQMSGFRNRAEDQFDGTWAATRTVRARPISATTPDAGGIVHSGVEWPGQISTAGPGQSASVGEPGARLVTTSTSSYASVSVLASGNLTDPWIENTQESLPAGLGSRHPVAFQIFYAGSSVGDLTIEYGAMGFQGTPTILHRNTHGQSNNRPNWQVMPLEPAPGVVVASHNAGAKTFTIKGDAGTWVQSGSEYALAQGVTTDLAVEVRPWAYNRDDLPHMTQKAPGTAPTETVARYDVVVRNLGNQNAAGAWLRAVPGAGHSVAMQSSINPEANQAETHHYFNYSYPRSKEYGSDFYTVLGDLGRTHFPIAASFGSIGTTTDTNPQNNTSETHLVVAGLSKHSAYFDGRTSGVVMEPHVSELLLKQNQHNTSSDGPMWMVDFWVKLPEDTPADAKQVVFSHLYGQMTLGFDGLRPQMKLPTGSGQAVYTATRALTPGVWHHVTFFEEHLNRRHYILIDGAPAGYWRGGGVTSPRLLDPAVVGAKPTLGGIENGGFTSTFRGWIDELRFLNPSQFGHDAMARLHRTFQSPRTLGAAGQRVNAIYRFEADGGTWALDFTNTRISGTQADGGNTPRTYHLYGGDPQTGKLTGWTWSDEHAPLTETVDWPREPNYSDDPWALATVTENGLTGGGGTVKHDVNRGWTSSAASVVGTPGRMVSAGELPEGELPRGITSRSDVRVHIAQNLDLQNSFNDPSHGIRTIVYYSHAGVPDAERRLLFRPAASGPWTDITDRAEVSLVPQHDRYEINATAAHMEQHYPAGEYAIGRRVGADARLAVDAAWGRSLVTLANDGPGVLQGAQVTVAASGDLVVLGADTTGLVGTFDPATRVWTLPNLPSGQSHTLAVRHRNAGTLTAEVTRAFTLDADSNPGDGQGDDFARGMVAAIPGGPGQALALGGNAYAEAAYAPELNARLFTVEAWIKPTGGSGHRHIVASRGDGSGYLLYLDEQNRLRGWVGTGNGGSGFDPTPLHGPLPLNEWTHVALRVSTFSTGGTGVVLLVNGKPAGNTGGSDFRLNTSRPLRIGSDSWDAPGSFFVGEIDEVRIWNRTLGIDEIAARASIRPQADDAGLAAYFSFNSASGTSEAAGRHSLTLSGAGLVPSTVRVVDASALATASTPASLGSEGYAADVRPADGTTALRVTSAGEGAPVAPQGEALAPGVVQRSGRVWSVARERGEAAALVTLSYAQSGIAPETARVLVRASAGEAWGDSTAAFVHDASARTFTGALTSDAQVALGVGAVVARDAGSALALDGSNTARTTADVDLSDSFSLGFWAQFPDAESGGMLLFQGSGGQGSVLHVSGGMTGLGVSFYGGDFSASTPASAAWHYWTVTYDRSTGERIVFRDGVELARHTAPTPYSGSGPLLIGHHPSTGQVTRGALDELRVWNRAISAAEVRRSMFEKPGRADRGLIHAWAFDEAGGAATTPDLVGGVAVDRGSIAAQASGAFLPLTRADGPSPQIASAGGLVARYADAALASRTLTVAVSGDPAATVAEAGLPGGATQRSARLWHVYGDTTASVSLSLASSAVTGLDANRHQLIHRPAAGAPWQFASGLSIGSGGFGGVGVPGDYALVEGLPNAAGAGRALALDGSGHAEVPYSADLNPDRFTVEAWVKPTSASDRRYVVGSAAPPRSGYVLVLDESNRLAMWTGDGTTDAWLTGPALPTDRWTHVAATHDGTTQRLYVGGTLVASQASPYAPQTQRPLRIGSDSWSDPALRFVGEIDEVRVWNRARTAAEITAGSAARAAGDEAGLAAAYRFDALSGATAYGQTGAHDGTLYGASRVASAAPLADEFARGTGALAVTGAAAQAAASGWLYRRGAPSEQVTGGLPGGITARSAAVWGVGGGVTALTLSLEGRDWIAHPAVLYRASASDPWRDATGRASATEQAVTVAVGQAQSGEYALASGAATRSGGGQALALQPATARGSVSLGATDQLGLAGSSFTFEAWVRPDALDGDRPLLGAVSPPGTSQSLHLMLRGGKPLMAFFANDTQSQTVLPADEWTHLAFVYDAQAQTQTIYVNGVQDVQGANRGALGGTLPLYLGRQQFAADDGGGTFFSGHLDEARLWNAALPADSIVARMRRSLTGEEAGLRLYLPFDADSDPSVARDRAGTAGDLRVIGTSARVRSTAPMGQTSVRIAGPGVQRVVGTPGRDAADVTLTGGTSPLDVYASGSADAEPVTPGIGDGQDETLPGGFRRRAARIWGLKPLGQGASADVTLHYGGLAGTDAFERVRLLRRAAPGSAWTDVSDEFTHDPQAATFSVKGRTAFSEYAVAEQGVGVELGLTARLEGAWDAGASAMRTSLAARGHLPTSQPYAAAPWGDGGQGYAGAEAVPAMDADGSGVADFWETGAGSGVVDWVLVQLRTGDPSDAETMTVAAQVAGLLHADGRVTAADGTSALRFAQAGHGAYHVAVFHRNHLPVVTAAPLDAASGAAALDATQAGALYGGAQMLGAGNAAVTVGRQRVQPSDGAAWQAAFQTGARGYALADLNLDGRVSPADLALWQQAVAAGAQGASMLRAADGPAGEAEREAPRARRTGLAAPAIAPEGDAPSGRPRD